jgi:hypothetical protein
MRAARNATPARSFIDQGWATRPVTLTGCPWRMAWDGMPGTLDREDLGLALSQSDQLHDIQRLAVLVGPGLLGVERQDRLWL